MILIIVDLFPFSGVVPADLLGIIRILASQGQFSIEDYNKSLERLGFSSYEGGDKPYPVPTSRSSKITKLKGHIHIQLKFSLHPSVVSVKLYLDCENKSKVEKNIIFSIFMMLHFSNRFKCDTSKLPSLAPV